MKLDLLAGLREIQGTRRKGGAADTGKFVMDVVAPEFSVNFDDEELAGAMAVQLVEIMRSNVLSGRRVDGAPAQPLAQSTIERRQYRLEQDLTGGQNGRYSTTERRKQKRNLTRRYKATKLGKFSPATNPAPGQNLRGVESGLLIKSMVAEPARPGWRIFFANIRALKDRKGTAPVQRALGLGQPGILQRVVQQPAAKKAAGNVLKKIALRQGKAAKLATVGDLLKNLGEAAQNVSSLAETSID